MNLDCGFLPALFYSTLGFIAGLLAAKELEKK